MVLVILAKALIPYKMSYFSRPPWPPCLSYLQNTTKHIPGNTKCFVWPWCSLRCMQVKVPSNGDLMKMALQLLCLISSHAEFLVFKTVNIHISFHLFLYIFFVTFDESTFTSTDIIIFVLQ